MNRMNRFVVNMRSPAHRALAAIAALAAGGAIAIIASTRPAPAQAAEQISVQAFALPSSAYSTPLASAELPLAPNPSGTGEWLIVSGTSTGTLLDEPSSGGAPTAVTANLVDQTSKGTAAPFLSLVAAYGYTWADADGGQMTGFTASGALAPLP